MKKPHSLEYSYPKGQETSFTQKEMKVEAKRQNVTFKPTYSPYAGHVAFKVEGALTKVRKFLDNVGLDGAKSLISDPSGKWVKS